MKSFSKDSLAFYFNQIAGTPLLAPEEEKELFLSLREKESQFKALLRELFPYSFSNVWCENRKRGRPGKESNINIERERKKEKFIQEVLNLKKAEQGIPMNAELSIPFPEAKPKLEEMQQLWKEMESMRQKIVRANLKFVMKVVRTEFWESFAFSFLDLVQEGNIGLLQAIPKFNPEMGYKFSTFAIHHIRKAIHRAIADSAEIIRKPAEVSQLYKQIRIAESDLKKQKEREITTEEIAEHLGRSEKTVRDVLASFQTPLSLETPLFEGKTYEKDKLLRDIIPSTISLQETEVTQKAQKEAIELALGELSAQWAAVIRLRFGLENGREKTLREAGEILGISREKVRQVEIKALYALRTKAKFLKDFID